MTFIAAPWLDVPYGKLQQIIDSDGFHGLISSDKRQLYSDVQQWHACKVTIFGNIRRVDSSSAVHRALAGRRVLCVKDD